MRRAEILAAIRRLLAQKGCEEVTVRGIADASGYALQTVYNLVGLRELAISEAICEYCLHVGRLAGRSPEEITPAAIVSNWITASKQAPEFARQVNLIFFSPSRSIFYRFRDRQLRGMVGLLRRHQRAGLLKESLCPQQVGEQLAALSTALWVEWADRPYPLERLEEKLLTGFERLLRE